MVEYYTLLFDLAQEINFFMSDSGISSAITVTNEAAVLYIFPNITYTQLKNQ